MPSIVPGQFYTWQFYLRAATLVPEFLDHIASVFWTCFAPKYRQHPFQITGLESASIPILTAILLAGADLGVNAFTIRKEYKTYGKGNIIEGNPNDLPIVFIDDLTSPQHKAFWHSARVIRRSGLELYPSAFVLVRKQYKDEEPEIVTSWGPIKIESVFTLDDFTLDFDDYRRRVEAA